MVHVQVRKEEVIDRLNVAEGNVCEAPIAAIEEQSIDGLATVDLHQQSVILASRPQDTKRDTHE